MPIPLQTPIVEHVGNGVTTVFAYPFGVLAAADLKVRVSGVDITSGFTVSGVGNRAGGSVTFAAAPANGAEVLLFREVQLKRDTDYQENGDLRESVLDDDFDRTMMALQDTQARFQRSITIPAGETFTSLPAASARANRVMGFGPDGEVVLISAFGGGGGAVDIVPANGSVTTEKIANGAVTDEKLAEDYATVDEVNAATAGLVALLDVMVPPGTISAQARLIAPTRWLLIDGKTIGNAASGATARANADTWRLYEVMWEFPVAAVPIFDSAGAPSTRGATAMADFNAGKRIPLFTPDGGAFLRMWTPGQTVDAGRVAGSAQNASRVLVDWYAVGAGRDTIADGGINTAAADMEAGSILDTYSATETRWIGSNGGLQTARTAAGRVRPYNLAVPHYIFLGLQL